MNFELVGPSAVGGPRSLGGGSRAGAVHGDLLEVEVTLDVDGLVWPDEEWLPLFRENAEFPGDLEEPRLEHGRLRFEVRDEDLQRAWSAISDRVAVTNRMYAAMLVPRDRSAQRSEDVPGWPFAVASGAGALAGGFFLVRHLASTPWPLTDGEPAELVAVTARRRPPNHCEPMRESNLGT
jgi:hypothetical protein